MKVQYGLLDKVTNNIVAISLDKNHIESLCEEEVNEYVVVWRYCSDDLKTAFGAWVRE
jgi:hypothetical protein